MFDKSAYVHPVFWRMRHGRRHLAVTCSRIKFASCDVFLFTWLHHDMVNNLIQPGIGALPEPAKRFALEAFDMHVVKQVEVTDSLPSIVGGVQQQHRSVRGLIIIQCPADRPRRAKFVVGDSTPRIGAVNDAGRVRRSDRSSRRARLSNLGPRPRNREDSSRASDSRM